MLRLLQESERARERVRKQESDMHAGETLLSKRHSSLLHFQLHVTFFLLVKLLLPFKLLCLPHLWKSHVTQVMELHQCM